MSGTNGTTVKYTAPGSCVIDANQAGNTDYAAAPEVQQSFDITVTPTPTPTPTQPLEVSTSALPGGTVGTSYSQPLSATGGTGLYTWVVTTGSLPCGLTLSGGGTISGTPTTAGTSTFTVKVTDSTSPTPRTATANLSITITLLALTPFPRANVTHPNGAIVNFGGTDYVFAGGRAFSIVASLLPAVQKVDHSTVLSACLLVPHRPRRRRRAPARWSSPGQ